MENEIIINYSDTLDMLDSILEKREHDWWNKFYSDKNKPIPFFKDIPDEDLIEYCSKDIFVKGEALDIGCGNGRNSRYLASQGFKVTGIDISEQSIEWAKELSDKTDCQVDFKCASMMQYEVENNTYDLILDSGCFHHIKPHRREQYLTRVQNCLKDNGYFLMTCFTPDGGANISDYDVYRDYSMHGGLGFSEFKIKHIMEAYFDIMDFRKMKETDNINAFGKDFMWVVLMKKAA